MWDLPRPGIRSISPALAGRLLNPGPLRKSHHCLFTMVTFTYIMKIFIFKNISNLNIFVIFVVRRKRAYILDKGLVFLSVQFSSVAQSCPTPCYPMNCSTPGLPVHHQLPEFTQTHVHRVGDAIQPSHPLSSPSPPAPIPSQHQGLFQWVNSLHEVAKVLKFQL